MNAYTHHTQFLHQFIRDLIDGRKQIDRRIRSERHVLTFVMKQKASTSREVGEEGADALPKPFVFDGKTGNHNNNNNERERERERKKERGRASVSRYDQFGECSRYTIYAIKRAIGE
jgi:hypothetical protein